VLKERIQEIFEFTKSESPYKRANKGWINQNMFLDLSPSPDTLKEKDEAAKITLFWSPITSLLSNIFFIIIISSLLVFTSLSFAKGRFNFNLFNNYLNEDIVKIEVNKVLETNDIKALDSISNEGEQDFEKNELEKKNNLNSFDDNQIVSDEEARTNETDKKEIIIKNNQTNKDIKISKNSKSKSNFI